MRIKPGRPRGRHARRAVVGAGVLSVAVVVALWLSHGGPGNARAPGGLAITAGRLTGLVAADLLIVQVLLMARIPWLERCFGQDILAHRHRQVGFVSFWLMMGHIALVTTGYAQRAGTGFPHEVWVLVTTYPGMLLAAAAAAVLLAVAALSIRATRRRMRYESWHLIHLYAYLGIGLALPHQIWTGEDFARSAAARAYWWTLYLGTLTAVVVFRVGRPLWRSLYHRIRVTAVVPEAPGVVSVYLGGHRLDRLPVRAGQFFLWRFAGSHGRSRANPFSLSALPGPEELRITVKQVGDGSARVARLRPGTRVFVEGPFGAVTAATRTQRRVLLMAAGIGITVIRALVEDLEYEPGDVTLIYRTSRAEDAVLRDELDRLAEARGVRVVYVPGARGRPDSCLPAPLSDLPDHEALARLVPQLADHDAYLCGPVRWMESARRALRLAGVPADRIHIEEFAW